MQSSNHTVATTIPSRSAPPAGTAHDDTEDDGEIGATAFGRRLRTLRRRVGLSQKQLAHASNLSVRAIRELENGRVRQPRADTLRLLADALGLSPAQMDRLANDLSLGLLARGAVPAVSGLFIARDQELSALTTMLGTERERLVTIAGIEGVGKTRLALEVVRSLQAVENSSVLWLPLDDDQLHPGTEVSERPTLLRAVVHPGPDSREHLIEAIAESDDILVLDGARPENDLAEITTDLLAECPRLRIIVTTRTPSATPLGTLFPLAPLPVPLRDTEPGELNDVPSVALLLAKMKHIQPAFQAGPDVVMEVARICRALDGLPAALESVAQWSLIYSLRQLAEQVTTDPLTVARPPHGSQPQLDAFASVHHTITALNRRQRDLLRTMSYETHREQDGYRSVSEVAELTGRTAAECADDIYHLLVLGILRRIDHHDVAMFRVLNIVGFAGHDAAA